MYSSKFMSSDIKFLIQIIINIQIFIIFSHEGEGDLHEEFVVLILYHFLFSSLTQPL